MTAAAKDLGDRAQGFAIDPALWDREDRVKVLRPQRLVAGRVCGVYPMAPEVVRVDPTTGGEPVLIRVQR